LGEDRKILEKKHHSLIKDLKRQLISEQQKNERLSEKMKELLSNPPSFSGWLNYESCF
jgi:Txe/YoeB family toxin of Txe-Axe toxin-antitoxin module